MGPSSLWQKEWRVAVRHRRALLLACCLPAATGGPLLLLAPSPRVAALSLTVALLLPAILGTAADLSRERTTGVLHRLVLTPVSPRWLTLHKLLARAALAGLQALPLVLLFLTRLAATPHSSAPAAFLPWLAAFALSLGATICFAVAIGGLVAFLLPPGGRTLLVALLLGGSLALISAALPAALLPPQALTGAAAALLGTVPAWPPGWTLSAPAAALATAAATLAAGVRTLQR